MALTEQKEIERFLRQQKDLTAWEMTRVYSTARQDFRIMGRPESQREVETDRLRLHLYMEREGKGKRVLGESSLLLDPESDYRLRIRRSMEMARLVENEPFSLPGPGQAYVKVDTFDSGMSANAEGTVNRVLRELGETSLREKVTLSSSEIEIVERRITFRNSFGLEASCKETELFLDFVLLAGDKRGHEAESHGFRRFRRMKDLSIPDLVDRYALFAQETLQAREPPTGRMDVVFSNECLDTLFRYFATQSGGPAAYDGWSRFKKGEPVVKDVVGDRLTMLSDPHLEGGMLSRAFDENGLATRTVEVICDGILLNRPVDSRYASYLKLPPTGSFANIVVRPGNQPLETLFEPLPVLHCLQFSTFDPIPYPGRFPERYGWGIGLRGMAHCR